MTNCKKSLLSVAAAMAISATSITADYIPLSTTAADNEWVLFGVNGFVTDGVVAATAGTFSITDNTANALIDPTVDEVAVSGFTVGGHDFGKIKAIDLTAPLEVRIDLTTTAPTWSEEEPVRTVYIDHSGDGAPNFSLEYKASLEGKTVEYTIDSGTAYSFTINYENTYDNPLDTSSNQIQGGGGSAGTELSELLDDNSKSAVDYDFLNNPPLVANYDHDDHRDAITTGAGAGNLRMYTYDAPNGVWQLFDTGNTQGSNDFETLTKGKGYWAKLDTDTGGAVDEEGGMVLGSSDLNSTDYINAGLTDGWNLLAFDNSNTQIRHASTGMIVTTQNLAGGNETMVVTDSSGNHSLTITLQTASTTTELVAKDINYQVSVAKDLGTMPKTFNLRAYRVSATEIALISNQKFSIHDSADDILAGATTLATFDATSRSLWDEATSAYVDYSAGDIALTDVTSVYGHSSMIIEPLGGAGTAQALALGSKAKIALASDGTESSVDMAATVALNQAAFDGTGTGGIISAHEVDLDNDGTSDNLILAATEPFYVRDNTFTRVFEFTDVAGAGVLKITNSGTAIADQDILIGDGTAAAVAATIDGVGDIGVADVGTKLVFVNDYDNSSDYKILETTADHLTVSTSSDDVAKGAVKGVYSADYLAKKVITNTDTIDLDEAADEAIDAYRIDFTTTLGNTVTGTAQVIDGSGWTDAGDNDGSGTDDYVEFLDALVLQLNTDLAAAGLTATASHDGVAAGNIGAALITVTGSEINDIALTQTAGAAEAVTATTPVLGNTGTLVPDITSNLRYNIEYTPNYVMDGPLFVMKEAGYKLNALVTGTMDIANGDITWDSIDLTRAPSEWLDSQDYNLFDTDPEAGYWAYLETDGTANPLSIGTATLSKNYTHHFDTDGTTFNEYSGNLDVNIIGIDYTQDNGASSRVVASINGKKIELDMDTTTPSITGTPYTGKISLFESGGISYNTAFDITISVSDGLGNNLTETLSVTVDNVKPAAPTATVSGQDVNVTTADTGVTGIYIFEGTAPEDSTAAAALGDALTGSGTFTGICEDMSPVTPATGGGSAVVSLNVIAVDGDGTFGAGNASNAATVTYMPILKDRVYVEDAHNGGVPVASNTGVDYNASCTNVGAVADTDLEISSISNGETVKVAFTNLNVGSTETPNSVYVTDGTVIAKLAYPDEYIGDGVYIELDGQMYEYTLIAEPAAGVAGSNDTNAIDISGDALTGISF